MEQKVILLAEDNEHDIFLTERALKRSNIVNKVVVANDGEEALDYLFGRGKYAGRDVNQTPAVVLLDLKMPKVDGLEVLKQMRENPVTKLVPVVMLTASNEDKDKVSCYTGGCNAYVTKPVDFEKFAEAIRELGLFWLVLNEPPPLPPKN